MDNTSYVIEVNHHYDDKNNEGSQTTPRNKTATEPSSSHKRKRKDKNSILKQASLIGGAVGYSIIKDVGTYTGDYGLTRAVNNSIKAVGLLASLTNPYTAAMSIIGTSNAIFDYSVKKRDNDFKANTLRQITGGINNGYRGRKL